MSKKVRINITVDEKMLKKARRKLDLFGGKVSTMFNAYLSDFVKTMGSVPGKEHEELKNKVKELELKVKKLERN